MVVQSVSFCVVLEQWCVYASVDSTYCTRKTVWQVTALQEYVEEIGKHSFDSAEVLPSLLLRRTIVFLDLLFLCGVYYLNLLRSIMLIYS